jgi:hypothetical protein
MAIHNRPVWQREFSYAESAYFSGTDDDFSAIGMSGLFDDLSGVAGHYYVLWGWQSLYVESAGGTIHHLALEIEDEDKNRRGIMHCSNDDNTVVMLPQPIRLKTGSGVYWEVLDASMSNSDIAHHEIFYSLVKEN